MTDEASDLAKRPSAVSQAAAWLRDQSPRPSSVVPELRKRFGLTPKEAVEAIQSLLKGA